MLVALESPTTTPIDASAGVDARSSFALREASRRHYWQGSGFLSVKAFVGGRALYSVDGSMRAVDDHSYLIVNHGQAYTIAIDAPAPVDSCCLFFSPRFVGEIYQSLISRTEALLEAPPSGLHAQSPAFFDRTYPHDALVSPVLQRLRQATANPGRRPTQGWLAGQSCELLCRLFVAQGVIRAEVEALPALRAATREELYRRLYRARDYIDALSDAPISLDDMARTAGLSPTHFLRTFRQAFHTTPHQYLVVRRLQHAQRLLRHSSLSVTAICFAIGFESLGSFSSLFKRWSGSSPQAYRDEWCMKAKR